MSPHEQTLCHPLSVSSRVPGLLEGASHIQTESSPFGSLAHRSVGHFWQCPCRHAQKRVLPASEASLNPVKLTNQD